MARSRMQPPAPGRIAEEPMIQVPSGVLALSSDEEELADAAMPIRLSPSNGNGNGNGHSYASGSGNGNGNKNGNGNGHAAPIPAAPAPKTTAQKIDEFYGVKKVGDEVIFAARFAEAKKVLIAGDFNNWSPMSTP